MPNEKPKRLVVDLDDGGEWLGLKQNKVQPKKELQSLADQVKAKLEQRKSKNAK